MIVNGYIDPLYLLKKNLFFDKLKYFIKIFINRKNLSNIK
jgi:hypothetical protein